jgi:excisionase family DNA binding protein
MLTTAEVAQRLGISVRRVQALIKAERLPARRFGRDWLIEEVHVDTISQRKVGYPKGRPRK